MSDSTAIDTELLTGPWNCSIEEYHADRQWLSHSALEIFRKSPRLYKRWFDGEWEREKTPEFRLGSALHAMLLEPDSFDQLFMAIDCASRNTKMYKEAASNEKREILLSSEFEHVMKMASAVKCHGWINRLIEYATKELAFRFINPLFDIPCKVRPDAIGMILHHGIEHDAILDLKTSRNPSQDDWIRDAARFGYHRQAGFYLKGLMKVVELPPETMVVHIVVGSQEPYDVFAYELDGCSMATGLDENEELLFELKERRDNNNWTERNYGKIATVSLPKWYLAKGWE